MLIKDKVVLITGAGGGIGLCLVDESISRGARKIYAADLKLESLEALKAKHRDKIVPVQLDVTSVNEVQACHAACHDVDVLINNAGVEFATSFLSEKAMKCASIEMAVNYHGVHQLCHAFWPSLLKKQTAAIINILSVASFELIFNLGTYCASKAAAHFLTQGLRAAATGTSIHVFGVYPGYVDTDMIKQLDVVKALPMDIAVNVFDAFEKDTLNIFPDAMSQALHQSMVRD